MKRVVNGKNNGKMKTNDDKTEKQIKRKTNQKIVINSGNRTQGKKLQLREGKAK